SSTPSQTPPLALVTGGAGDVGAATGARLIADGWRVLLADRDLPGARDRAEGLGSAATAAHLDLSEEDSIARLAEQVAAQTLLALVSCAGLTEVGGFEESRPQTWDMLWTVNLRGPMLLTQAL